MAAALEEDQEPEPDEPVGWQPIWKLVAASAVLTGAIVLAVALRPGPDTPIAPAGEALMADTGMLATEDDGSWEFVVGLSADLAFWNLPGEDHNFPGIPYVAFAVKF